VSSGRVERSCQAGRGATFPDLATRPCITAEAPRFWTRRHDGRASRPRRHAFGIRSGAPPRRHVHLRGPDGARVPSPATIRATPRALCTLAYLITICIGGARMPALHRQCTRGCGAACVPAAELGVGWRAPRVRLCSVRLCVLAHWLCPAGVRTCARRLCDLYVSCAGAAAGGAPLCSVLCCVVLCLYSFEGVYS